MQIKKLVRSIIGDRLYIAAHDLKVWRSTVSAAPQTIAAPPAKDPLERSGRQSETFWATREKDNPSWVMGYWNGRTLPARAKLAETIASLGVKTVLEVGSHSGANLWAIDQAASYVLLAGIELSEHVLEASKTLLAGSIKSPYAVQLGNGKGLPFENGRFDVVLSSIMLSCVGPENVKSVLSEMVRVSNRYIVLAEPFEDSRDAATPQGKPDPYPNTTYWRRNYLGLLQDMGFHVRQVSIQHLNQQDFIGHLDSIQVLEIYQP